MPAQCSHCSHQPYSYAILDRYAVESLGHRRRGQYPPTFWVRYLGWPRAAADAAGLTAREIDKALWEHGKRRARAERARQC